jgi:hypothetical protein
MTFRILSEISAVETIASGAGIREISRLRKLYGRGRWRKRKGIADVQLRNGRIVRAEIHWYEADTSARRNSRSSASYEEESDGQDGKTPRHLRRQHRLRGILGAAEDLYRVAGCARREGWPNPRH